MVSCFKDKYKVDYQDNTDRLILEFPAGANEINAVNLDYANTEVDITDIVVGAYSRSVVSGTSTVTVTLNPTLIADYNTAYGTAYDELPASLYTIGTYTYTISPDKPRVPLKIKVNPADLLGGNYALGFSISQASAGEISQIHQNVLFTLGVKNKYDGIYQSKGYSYLGTTNTTAPYLFSTDCAWELNVITTGLNTVELDAQPVFRQGQVIYYSNVTPAFTFDLSTNKVTGVSAAPGSVPMNFPYDASYDSRYDPATKTIYVKFGVNNNPAWYIIDTLVYCGPR